MGISGRIEVAGGVLEVQDEGHGEPVVFVPTALNRDEFRPLSRRPELRDVWRLVSYHRRGYGHSSPPVGTPSVAREVEDCCAVIEACTAGPVHLFGGSYSAAIALDLAADRPDLVRTLTVVEPPPTNTAMAPTFLAANERLEATMRDHGVPAALEELATLLFGPQWRAELEQQLPGAATHVEQDAETFFTTDLPALVEWRTDAERLAAARMPVLSIGGTESGPLFDGILDWVRSVLPQAEEYVVAGAGHDLPLTHPGTVARVTAEFLSRK